MDGLGEQISRTESMQKILEDKYFVKYVHIFSGEKGAFVILK